MSTKRAKRHQLIVRGNNIRRAYKKHHCFKKRTRGPLWLFTFRRIECGSKMRYKNVATELYRGIAHSHPRFDTCTDQIRIVTETLKG